MPSGLAIQEIFGGGGSSAGVPNADYVVLQNNTGTAISLAGYALQVSSASGAFTVIPLSGTVAPYAYFLIQVSAAGATGTALTPDLIASSSLGSTAGRVALTSDITQLPTFGASSGGSILDFVGYGTAFSFEGAAAAPAPSNTTSISRNAAGGMDADQNGTDFANGTPSPKNSATTADSTGAPTITSSATASLSENTTAVLTVTATDAEALSYAILLPAGGNGAGADGALFSINSATGALSFAAAPNFEAGAGHGGTSNEYLVTVRVTDSGGSSSDQHITVTVTDANEPAPVIASSDPINLGNITEDVSATLPSISITDADSTVLTVTLSSIASSIQLTLHSTTGLTFLPGGGDGTLDSLMTFTGSPSDISAAISGMHFVPFPNSTGIKTVSLQVSDGTNTTSRSITMNYLPAPDPPSVALQNTSSPIDENTSTATHIKVADIVVTDVDGSGTYAFGLTGTDATSFEIVGTELFLKAGVTLDFETKQSYAVAVTVDDLAFPPFIPPPPIDATSPTFTLTIGDVNEAPSLVTSLATVTVLAENTSAAAHIKVADIVVTDDAFGSETLALVGADAGFFEIVGTELFLKAGVKLDFETKSSYSVAVTADDTDVGGTPDATSSTYTLLISNVSPETILGTAAANTLIGGSDRDFIFGLAGSDKLIGGGNNDRLIGAAGNDILTGGLGVDTLIGGFGRDVMAGNAQRDIFDFNLAGETGKTAFTRDVIRDFSHAQGDDIDLSTIDAKVGIPGNQAFSFIGQGAFTGVKGQLHYKFEGPAKTIVEGDIDGNKVADFQIELTGHKLLVGGDFIL